MKKIDKKKNKIIKGKKRKERKPEVA